MLNHARAAMLRSRLTGDALAESQLSPEQHAELQEALAQKGFLRADQIGSGTHDGEFGPITRKAIKQFQESLSASPSGFLSDDQRSALLERPGEREARVARADADAKRAAQDAAEEKAKRVAENERLEAEARKAKQDAERREKSKRDAENERLEAEAAKAKEWRRSVDEARIKGGQYADKSEFKWSLSEIDNPMTDDKDYTVASAQVNGRGAACSEPRLRQPLMSRQRWHFG